MTLVGQAAHFRFTEWGMETASSVFGVTQEAGAEMRPGLQHSRHCPELPLSGRPGLQAGVRASGQGATATAPQQETHAPLPPVGPDCYDMSLLTAGS